MTPVQVVCVYAKLVEAKRQADEALTAFAGNDGYAARFSPRKLGDVIDDATDGSRYNELSGFPMRVDRIGLLSRDGRLYWHYTGRAIRENGKPTQRYYSYIEPVVAEVTA